MVFDEQEFLECKAIVNISGKKSGKIYITTNEEMISEFYNLLLGGSPHSQEEIKDLVGEIANKISGNLEQNYGKKFEMSVPQVITIGTDDIILDEIEGTYVFPFTWLYHKGFVVANIN